MTPPPSNALTVTAAQLARSLGKSRRWVADALGVPELGLASQGDHTQGPAFGIACLPEPLRQQLAEVTSRRGYRSIEDLVSAPVERWQPAIPLGEVADKWVSKAVKLQRALLPTFKERADDQALSPGEYVALGLRDYRAEFGYEISERQWRRLVDRTVQRDRGFEDWQRVELFLDDNAARRADLQTAAVANRFAHRELDDVVHGLNSREDPTADDRSWLWDSAFRHFETLLGQHADRADQKEIKTSLVRYLFGSVPGLSKTPKSLRRDFERKLSVWRQQGATESVLQDRRRLDSGNFRRPEFAADRFAIAARAVQLGGNETLAHRQLRREGKLSREFCEYYDFDLRRAKSYVPHSIRQAVTPDVNACGPIHRGPWEAKMRGPYIQRDWSGVEPGDWFVADDVTWNHYFWYTDDQGQKIITRGECLLMCDLRSAYPLDFLLIAGHYNSEHVRSLALRAHDKYGLPRQGFYFENGVWSSKLVKGDRNQGGLMHKRETERGLRERGLDIRIKNATTPRAKPIEGLFHILQDAMRDQPGFVGFNERTDKQERMQDFLARVKRGKEDPRNELLSMEQWTCRLGEILRRFEEEPQNGKMLPGRSPKEAWSEATNRRPLRKLADEARYILATHKTSVRVRQEGIVLTIRGKRRLYCGEETGSRIGREVLAFYSIERPDLLIVSDLDRQNYFTLRSVENPAMTPTREQYEEVNGMISAHMKPVKVMYGQMQERFAVTISRDTDHDQATMDLGRFHNDQVDLDKEEKAERGRKLSRIRRNAEASGRPAPSQIDNPDRVLEGQQLESEALARLGWGRQTESPAHRSPD
jgi:hypothetical protein